MSISVILLAYKEAENLKVMLPKLHEVVGSLGEDYDINVIDTKTATDNTEEVCKELNASYYHQEKPGFGGAYCKGLEIAKGDKILFLDSDGSHDPKYIPVMYKKYTEENLNLVVGSRYTKGGESNDSKSSQIMSHILNFVFRIVLGINIKDVSTNFRIYDAKLVKDIDLKSVNYDVLEEILLIMKKKAGPKNFRYGEIPISFNKRIYGESKRRLIPFIISYIKTIFRLIGIRIRG